MQSRHRALVLWIKPERLKGVITCEATEQAFALNLNVITE